MYSTSILLSLLAATGSLAAPARRQNADNEIRVVLQNQAIELGVQVAFPEGGRRTDNPNPGPYETVELSVGAAIKQQDIRCQILDNQDKPIEITRLGATDITFSDADKGLWNIVGGAKEVKTIVCDPSFKKRVASDADNEIRVILQNQAIELGSTTIFKETGNRDQQSSLGSSGPFETVELELGSGIKQKDLRCQILDHNNQIIEIIRNGTKDITFSDQDKGLWTLVKGAQTVTTIICDPTFKKLPPATLDTTVVVTLDHDHSVSFDKAGLVREAHRVGGRREFSSVNLEVGKDVSKQGLRCIVLDHNGHAIKIQRKENKDTTFSDADKGKWDFIHPSKSAVSKIICDPAFVSANA